MPGYWIHKLLGPEEAAQFENDDEDEFYRDHGGDGDQSGSSD